jgi:hypothetical protein
MTESTPNSKVTHKPNRRKISCDPFGFYALAFAACAFFTFGPISLVPAAIVIGLWMCVFSSRSRPRALAYACVPMGIALIMFPCCVPIVSSVSPAARRSACKNNLKQIGIALLNYHEWYGSFPAATTQTDADQPAYSWRVALLPFLDGDSLHQAYDFGQPWDSDTNRKILSAMPYIYRCPAESTQGYREHFTRYVAVAGPGTTWPEGRGENLEEINDGAESTFIVLEVDGCKIPWTEPRDLTYDEALSLLTATEPESHTCHPRETYFWDYFGGQHALAADGRVYFVPHGTDADYWSAMLTVDDERPNQDWVASRPDGSVRRRLKIENCCRHPLFLVLVLLPLPWVWRKPRTPEPQKDETSAIQL